MSARERAQMIINGLTDEQLEELVEYIEENFLPEPPNSADSVEEIEALLEEAEDDVRNGRVYSWEEVKAELEEKYGI